MKQSPFPGLEFIVARPASGTPYSPLVRGFCRNCGATVIEFPSDLAVSPAVILHEISIPSRCPECSHSLVGGVL